jgi:recombination associated protein RdgC
MRDPAEAKSVVRWSDFDLNDPSIRDHVANGMRLTHLGIVYDNIMSCVVDENGVVSKIRFLGVDDDIKDDDGALARQDAEFVLASGVLRNLLGDLSKALGGFA